MSAATGEFERRILALGEYTNRYVGRLATVQQFQSILDQLAELYRLAQNTPELNQLCEVIQGQQSEASGQLSELRRTPNVLEAVLVVSASKGDDQYVQELLDMGANVAHREEGLTALVGAVIGGHCGVVDKLLSHHADIDQSTTDGWTPLHLACLRGNKGEAVAMKLFQAGANIEARITENGCTPLHVACAGGSVCEAIVMKLLRAGAHEAALTDNGRTPEDLLREGNDGVRVILNRVSRRRAWAWLDISRKRTRVGRTKLKEPRRSPRLPDARVVGAVAFLHRTDKDMFHVVMSFL